MKHLNTRRIRKAAKRLVVRTRRIMRRDSFAVVATLSVLGTCLCLSSTTSASGISAETTDDSSLAVPVAQVGASPEFSYKTSPYGVLHAALPAESGLNSPELIKALETTSGTTLDSVSTESTTTTKATTVSSPTEETQSETVTETEDESENETEATESTAWTDVEEDETDSGFEAESTEGSVYDYVSEDEIIMLAKTVAQEGGDCSYTQQACVVWTVLNRVDSWEWPNTISENLNMGGQFAYYSWKPYRDDHYQVAYDQVYNWLFGGERYLGSDYQYFYGDGWRNHFYGKNSSEYVPD